MCLYLGIHVKCRTNQILIINWLKKSSYYFAAILKRLVTYYVCGKNSAKIIMQIQYRVCVK